MKYSCHWEQSACFKHVAYSKMSDTDPKTLHETHYERLIIKRSFYINEQTYLWTRQHATTQCDYKINSNNINKASKWTNNLSVLIFHAPVDAGKKWMCLNQGQIKFIASKSIQSSVDMTSFCNANANG